MNEVLIMEKINTAVLLPASSVLYIPSALSFADPLKNKTNRKGKRKEALSCLQALANAVPSTGKFSCPDAHAILHIQSLEHPLSEWLPPFRPTQP